MKKLHYLFLFGLLLVAALACEPRGFGPRYDVEGNLAKDREIIDNFLKTARIDSLYRIHDPNGVIIIVQEEGTGDRPTNGNTIYTNYVAKLLDGTVVDTNLKNVAIENDLFSETQEYRIFQFLLGSREVIEGWNLAFRRMKSTGTKAVLIVPSPWAYQDREQDRIPANSVMMFDIEFLGMD